MKREELESWSLETLISDSELCADLLSKIKRLAQSWLEKDKKIEELQEFIEKDLFVWCVPYAKIDEARERYRKLLRQLSEKGSTTPTMKVRHKWIREEWERRTGLQWDEKRWRTMEAILIGTSPGRELLKQMCLEAGYLKPYP